ncbi:MAG: hypothetical protein O3B31_13900 [Chloroflexi bacterium]|nr:hypothetical protein [Chloroflexota bacterium]MDA1004415.1 hypothetical protein [Chloroflexota bacterium]
MRTSPRIARIALGCAVVVSLAIAACGGESATAGATLADRWLRIGEDLGTAVDVYDGALPPDLVQLLNAGVTAVPGEPELALPVHPDARLLGSFHLRRPDASNLVWLIFDVPGTDAAVHGTVSGQLDQSPWQVVGGQSSVALSVVRFQSTLNGNIDGTAVIRPLPTTSEFTLEIQRAENKMTLTVARGAPSPLIEADLVARDGGVAVRRVDGGAVGNAGLAVDDQLLAVAGEPVQSLADVDRALRGLVLAGEPSVSLVYILELGAGQVPREPSFVLPAGRALPERFPAAFLVDDTMTVLDVSWSSQGGQGAAYQATLVTATEGTTVTSALRDAIEEQGWEITGDQAIGFATQLDFASTDGAIAGRARIDSFAADPALTTVALQIQTTPASGG